MHNFAEVLRMRVIFLSLMKYHLHCRMDVLLFALFSFATTSGFAQTNTAIVSRTATVDGAKLQYLTAARGPAVILLHAYTQTSRMWKRLLPTLPEQFRVTT